LIASLGREAWKKWNRNGCSKKPKKPCGADAKRNLKWVGYETCLFENQR